MTDPDNTESDADAPAEPLDARVKGFVQIGLVVGVLAAGLIANRILSSNSTAPQIQVSGAAIMVVDAVQPMIQDTQIRVAETGTVQVRNSIDLSPQVSGRVVMVNSALASGGRFRRGEILFRLDDSDYQASIERARADLSSRQADLQVEQTEAEIAIREWELVRPNEPVPPNVAREPQLARAEASVRSAEAALADARLDLNRVTFTLPFDGRVLSTNIEVGQNLLAGQSYGRAYDPDGIEVSVPVQSGVLASLGTAVGREAIVLPRQGPLSQSDIVYEATVTRADAELDAQTRLARLSLEFTDAVPLLPGDFVDVEISGPIIPNAYLIPEAAIQENRSVWVVDGGALARRQPQLVSLEGGFVATLPFDSADGIIVSALDNPQEGDVVEVAGAVSAEGDSE